jgi:hypothetical protein
MAIAAIAEPNDGWVGYGGAPKLMKGHPTVRLVDERVVLYIKKKTKVVDCSFVFKNEGPATTVRMGFPDQDSSYDVEGEQQKSTFNYFRSYVDGKRYGTKFTLGERGNGWQVKHVPFARGQSRRIRNVYEVALGRGNMGGIGGSVHYASYILETGASWKGKIGKTEIVVVFGSTYHPRPTRLLPYTEASSKGQWWRSRRSTVLWQGPSKPRLSGNMIFFTRKNWEPTVDDDLTLTFNWLSRSLS